MIGPSDSGKSNLVRALRDWAFGAPGVDMISVGSNVARVALAIDGRFKVVWERRGDSNWLGRGSSYYLADAESEAPPIKFEKIGHGVPEEIQNVTGVREITVDDLGVRVQFAEQADPWFLLANPPWTPGKITKIVGKAAGLDALILANRDLERERINENREATRTAKYAAKQRDDLKEFVGLDRALELVARAEAAFAEFQQKRARFQEAQVLLAQIKARRAAVDVIRARVVALRPVLERVTKLQIDQRRQRLAEARGAFSRWATADQNQAAARKRLESSRSRVEAVAAEFEALAKTGDLVCPLCSGPAHAECRARLVEEARVSA